MRLPSLPFVAVITLLPLPAQDPAELLATLSLEQKAGQLFMCWSLASETPTTDKGKALLTAVADVGLGGVILSLGSVEQAAALVPQLQAAAKVPLLLAGDFEGGVAFRLTGATEMGNQMLVGAGRRAALARAMGEVTGREAKALGFHWVFAPVLDVNNNPLNPIINVRSFGEDPELVARLGAAFAAGVRSSGLLACGKHFPGHGNVDSDSHLALPTVPGDGERLRSIELRPFQVAAAAGLESVMTGHLAVPGLGEDPATPATLSRKILGDVLRTELGFTGLLVTDALEMGGVKNAFPAGEVAVRALLAGADVLLMPPDPKAARDAVVQAVQSARVPMARLDEAVLRILTAKARVGLLSGGGRVAADWRAQVGTAAGAAVGGEIAARGVTVVRDPAGLVPLAAVRPWAIVTLLDKDDATVGAALPEALAERGVRTGARFRLHPGSSSAEVDAAVTALRAADGVVLAMHVKVREFSGTIGLPPALRPVAAALPADRPVVAISFGNPYLVQGLPANVAYACAYAGSPVQERAVADVLVGRQPATGRLPVSIPGVAAAGAGVTFLPGRDLAAGDPADHGIDPQLGERLHGLLAHAVQQRVFPGAVCVVARHGVVIAQVAVGRHDYDAKSAAVTLDTPWDLASLTKVCATTPAVLRAAAAGKLALDDPVQKWLPAFVGVGKERVTIRHLLAHAGGLPAYERYYRTIQGRDAIVAAAAAEGLMTEPGSTMTYSDLGFVLLMAVVERATGQPFADYVAQEVFAPLGMAGARFAPTAGAPLAAPPTENDPARGGIVRGFVHDENAFAMGGISGHAGMFGTAFDVARVGVAFLGCGRGFLPSALAQQAVAPAGLVPGSTRALGFDRLQSGGFGGTSVPAGAFGHTGFTGTSLWCDPGSGVGVVLLTNRVHPTRVNSGIAAVRQAVHDAVLAATER
ncbi:MAG: serine hydrolase [Planctomycetes bacterium]|nr:serine hydrolase [Planctomycetota bacterium]